ncbi:acyl-CoA dehydrogenase family protein [Xenophilus arseniciresistens]|uniref:Acyl-CoA dehydrogenase family protein n=1 Tax=Xenophilus arseniciresistens TaxID=1283306 RepID=A0AAE3SZM5_9BURK|nr:acyl-CoA dehydrogenase family protein [Xenophilus arseniciresistens]MDA7416031.1 acyl-CoA dehydrogenase family protein [Xenophilus arseniciresistens]
MDLDFTDEELAFREQVRTFFRDRLPADIAQKVERDERLGKADYERWHAILNAQGWLATGWPKEHGGPGWTAMQRYLFEFEGAMANAPRIIQFGINMLAPVLMKFGTPEQKRRWLPRILDGRDWWCQGYSEPGAGSDLASLRTTAVRTADGYVVNGQKTWTTLGQHANMIFCLVRTDPAARKQQGISFLLIDMHSPGVELRPIITLDGEHEVNEVFFTDVRVPLENLVGHENEGWSCAKFLLTHERTGIAGVGYSCAALQRLKQAAAHLVRNGRPLLQDRDFAARLARVEIALHNMKTTNLKVLAGAASGAAPGVESSMLKIQGTEIRQEIHALMLRAMGPHAPLFANDMTDAADLDLACIGPANAPRAALTWFNNRKLSIFGGSNEIQKNIIAKTVLGL